MIRRYQILGLICALGLGAPPPAHGDEPPPFAQFTFKRVKPPAPGTRQRITIQITEPQDSSAPATSGIAAAAPVPGDLAPWFWGDISPAISASGPGRLQSAVAQLDRAPDGFGAVSLSDLGAIAREHGRDILLASVGKGVSPALILAVISVESAGRLDATSHVGAQGLMQLMPETSAAYGVDDPMDPTQNIRGGTAFLSHLLARFGGDPVLSLAAYNAGETAVLAAAGVPDFPETRQYVPKVIAAWTVARGLCVTPPELVSDGCVFATNVVTSQ